MKELSQHDKIIAIMQSNPQIEWFYAPDFQRSDLGELFVGYEATARMSELVRNRPDLVEAKRVGKYRYIRLRNQQHSHYGTTHLDPVVSAKEPELPI